MTLLTPEGTYKKRCLNVGCGKDIRGDDEERSWVNLDLDLNKLLRSTVDIAGDVTDIRSWTIAHQGAGWIPHEEFDEVLCSHVIEHVMPMAGGDLRMMENLHKVTKPGGLIQIRCPFATSFDAFEDPTHVRFMTPNRFHYYAQYAYWRADYGYRGDWQLKALDLVVARTIDGVDSTRVPPAVHIEAAYTRWNHVLEMIAVMECVKPIRPQEAQPWDLPLSISVGDAGPVR